MQSVRRDVILYVQIQAIRSYPTGIRKGLSMKNSKKGRLTRRLLTVLLGITLTIGAMTSCSTDIGQNGSHEQQNTTTTEGDMSSYEPETTPDYPVNGYLIVPEEIKRDGVTDVTQQLQTLIYKNPKRTIFFPDGTYLISKPLLTSANPSKTVSLVLSQYAVIKADAKKWDTDEAMIRLGGGGFGNNAERAGSHTVFRGGVVDGSGIASGISIDSGIQTVVTGTTLINTKVGLHIKNGANGGSADADISGLNIVGTGKTDSTGIIVDAHDNTFTNIRIGKVQVGVELNKGANMLRNVHPLYYGVGYIDYENSCAFWDKHGTNWYDFCYSDQFGTAFRLGDGVMSFFNNCYVFWYEDRGDNQTVFRADGRFESIVDTLRVCFRNKTDNTLLRESKAGGSGTFEKLYIDNASGLSPKDAYKKHLK